MSSLSDSTQDTLKEVFDLYKSIDGKLCIERVGDAVRAAGLVPTNEEINNVLKNETKKSMAFEQLCSIYEHLSKNCKERYQDLSSAMKVIDRDQTGKIPIAELKHMLTTVGERMADDMVDEVLDGLQEGNAFIDITGNSLYATIEHYSTM